MSRPGCGGPILGCLIGIPVALVGGAVGGIWGAFKIIGAVDRWSTERAIQKNRRKYNAMQRKYEKSGNYKEWSPITDMDNVPCQFVCASFRVGGGSQAVSNSPREAMVLAVFVRDGSEEGSGIEVFSLEEANGIRKRLMK